jgi:quercetin dioxygenase-like cupin family protein
MEVMMEESKPAEMQLGYAKIDEAPTFDPAFYKLDEIPVVTLREGVTARFVLGGRMMMSFVHLAPGAEMPLHDHHHEQIGHMVEGTMYLTIGDDERLLRPGDAYTIPGGVPHRAVGGPEGGLALDIFSPPREQYLEIARQSARK